MTYKASIAGVDLGGGKSVILGDPYTGKSEALLQAMGRAIDALGGAYIAGQDIANPLAGNRRKPWLSARTHPPMEDRVARLRSGEWQYA